MKFKTFVSDTHQDLENQLNEHFRGRKCIKEYIVQLATNGEAIYAVLVAWEEE